MTTRQAKLELQLLLGKHLDESNAHSHSGWNIIIKDKDDFFQSIRIHDQNVGRTSEGYQLNTLITARKVDIIPMLNGVKVSTQIMCDDYLMIEAILKGEVDNLCLFPLYLDD